MNLAKNMEAIFVAATIAICAISYSPSDANAGESSAQGQQIAAQTQVDSEVQTVVIVAKRV